MASRKVSNLGIIGIGRWGPNLLKNFNDLPNCNIRGVADLNKARLEGIKAKFPSVDVYSNPESIFLDKSIDSVIICTPTESHFDLCKAALEKGKNVFIEKPLAKTSAQGQILVDLAKRKNLVLFVGHVFVYNAGIQEVKKYLEREELGEIYYLHIARTNLGPVRTDVGAHWDLASHDISILNYWFPKGPLSVSATGANFLNPQILDCVFLNFVYPENIHVNIHASWLNPNKVREITIIGSKKMLVWDDMNLTNPIKIYDKSIEASTPYRESTHDSIVDSFLSFRSNIYVGDTFLPKISVNEPLLHECKTFLDIVQDVPGVNSLSSGEEGLKVLYALERSDDSIEQDGKRLDIIPTGELL